MEESKSNTKIDKDLLERKIKKIIFNRFYIEFIIYILILNMGFMLGNISYQSTAQTNMLIIYGIINSLIVSAILYLFGYIIARKRKGANKLFPSVCFAVIVLTFYLISYALNGNSSTNVIIRYFNKIYAFIATIHYYTFYWIEKAFDIKLSMVIYILLGAFLVFLGSKRNLKREKKKKIFEKN